MNIINRLKQRWHKDLISDPVSHGWVLNLYLHGERYPQMVCDYFQSEYAPTRQLAEQLRQHARDEQKHELLFAKGLKIIHQQVVQLPIGDAFNEVVRCFTPSTFHIIESDPRDDRRKKLANFLAHAHFLEKRIAKSLCYHVDACDVLQCEGVAKIVSSVLKDEDRHVRYTRESVLDLLTRQEAYETLDLHKRAEARANLKFSATQMKDFLRRMGKVVPAHRRQLYRFCAMIMEEAIEYV